MHTDTLCGGGHASTVCSVKISKAHITLTDFCAVIQSERFQHTGGRGFLFYRPGVSDVMFEGLWQQTVAGIQLVNERGQVGSSWDKHGHFTAPYSSTNDIPSFG